MWLLIYSLICAGLAQVLLLLMFKMSVSESKRVIKRGKRRLTDPSCHEDRPSVWSPMKQVSQGDSSVNVESSSKMNDFMKNVFKSDAVERNAVVVTEGHTPGNDLTPNRSLALSDDQQKAGDAHEELVGATEAEKEKGFETPTTGSLAVKDAGPKVVVGDGDDEVFEKGPTEKKKSDEPSPSKVGEGNDALNESRGIDSLVAGIASIVAKDSLTKIIEQFSPPKAEAEPGHLPESGLLEPERRKVIPLPSDHSNYEDVIETDEELEGSTSPESTDTRGNGLNNLGMDVTRTVSEEKTVVTPYNVDSSADSSIDNQTMIGDADLLGVEGGDEKKRVSVSEPAEAPAGCKTVATAMEIGLVRDVVFNVAVVHGHLTQSSNPLGKAYSFWFRSTISCYKVAKVLLSTSGKIYQTVAPAIVQRSGDAIQREVWRKLTDLDDGISSRISLELSRKPFMKKSVIGSVADSKLYRKIVSRA